MTAETGGRKRPRDCQGTNKHQKRERVSSACVRCRKRKAKCDGDLPCNNCVKGDVGKDCSYPSESVRVDASYLAKLETLAREVNLQNGKPIVGHNLQNNSTTSLASHNGQVISSSSSKVKSEPFQHRHNVDTTSSESSTESHANSNNLTLLASICDMKDSGTASLHPFIGSISDAANKLMKQSSSPEQRSSIDIGEESDKKDTGNETKKNYHIYQHACSNSNHFDLPPRQVVDRLVKVYFERVHLTFPILHWPSFMEKYENLWQTSCRHDISPFWLGLLNTMALACQVGGSAAIEGDSYKLGISFYQRHLSLTYPIVLASSNFEALQGVLLMCQYLLSISQPNLAWNTIGHSVRFAQCQNIHLPSSYLYDNPIESECKKRAWAAVVTLESTASATLGLPPSLSVTEFPVERPANVDDEVITSESVGPQPIGRTSRISFFIESTYLYGIQLEVVRILYRPTSTSSTNKQPPISKILALDGALAKWENALPSHLKPGDKRQVHLSDDLLSQADILNLRRLNVKILIHRVCLSYLCQESGEVDAPSPKRSNANTSSDTSTLVPSDWQATICRSSARTCCNSALDVLEIVEEKWHADSIGAWWFHMYYAHSAALAIIAGLITDLNYSLKGYCSTKPNMTLCIQDRNRAESALNKVEQYFHELSDENSKYLLHVPDGRRTASRCKDVIVRLRLAMLDVVSNANSLSTTSNTSPSDPYQKPFEYDDHKFTSTSNSSVIGSNQQPFTSGSNVENVRVLDLNNFTSERHQHQYQQQQQPQQSSRESQSIYSQQISQDNHVLNQSQNHQQVNLQRPPNASSSTEFDFMNAFIQNIPKAPSVSLTSVDEMVSLPDFSNLYDFDCMAPFLYSGT